VAISGDGHCVAFVSSATNLVPCDTNNKADVFVHCEGTTPTTIPTCPTTSTTLPGGHPSFAEVEAGLDALLASVQTGVPAGPLASALANLIGKARTLTSAAEQASRRQARTKLNKAARAIGKVGKRLRTHKAVTLVPGDTLAALRSAATNLQQELVDLRSGL
jgi:hypothetical protein